MHPEKALFQHVLAMWTVWSNFSSGVCVWSQLWKL